MLSSLTVTVRLAHSAVGTNGRLNCRQAAFTARTKRFAIADKLAAISAPLGKENTDNKAFQLVTVHLYSPKAYI